MKPELIEDTNSGHEPLAMKMEKTSADPVNHTNAFMLQSITLIMKMGNVTENVVEMSQKF